ncbi:copper amine oxidase N-terminal domain-containing protein [Caldalkalibacillus salinus]|uniref:copper amine oxidase N-terminal domain-containing protein n=1 Tax=Caldalkalibacillus salinus TaxID=2803787 RepID=UPI001921A27A|nr:copper amine oxidase N-terminal domain-containing protein [Caldalkalibacillus salinus]
MIQQRVVLITMFVIAVLMLFPQPSLADSPVTSTPISNAYTDIDMVQQAQETGDITADIAEYLASPEPTLDVKAAVINAMYNTNMWDIRDRANTYTKLIHGARVEELTLDTLEGDQLFIIGYLLVLDDYFHPERAQPYLKGAQEAYPDSLTVSMIAALTKAQGEQNWCEVWLHVKDVLADRTLNDDLREEAVQIITDYMFSYHPYCQDEVSIMLNDQVQVYAQDPVIVNGRTLVPMRGIFESLQADVKWDNETKSVTAVREDVKIYLQIGDHQAMMNGHALELDTEAIIVNQTTMVPLRFVSEALGAEVEWDGEHQIVHIRD